MTQTIEIPPRSGTAFVVEEIGELGIPVMFLAAILLWPGPSLTTAHPTNRAHRV